MRDIQLILSRWGAWAFDGNSNIDYSSIAAGFKGLIVSNKKSRESCCDDDGIAIDAAVSNLKKNNSYLFQLVIFYYVRNCTLRTLASKLGISHNEVAKRLQYAEGYIEGCLAISGVTLEMDRYTKKDNIYGVA
ncbi:antiterminator Q family protein [Providencia rettgeri]|uniref:antiterminator Q family protein n=1 Tax=Providencia rettgeri TaxID=587 RepID=UPI00221FAB7C|nr:antiterminator Q family protein [Providencia rettgeri]ELR5278903.1 antitermination protein [Providencia rettgeri]UYV43200.1 antiterminator Q family protein [Providencia rettgeri]